MARLHGLREALTRNYNRLDQVLAGMETRKNKRKDA